MHWYINWYITFTYYTLLQIEFEIHQRLLDSETADLLHLDVLGNIKTTLLI